MNTATPKITNEVRVYNLTIDRMVSYYFDTYQETAKFVKNQKKKYPDTRLYYVDRPCKLWNTYCICRGNRKERV